jgi:hypothetical protein
MCPFLDDEDDFTEYNDFSQDSNDPGLSLENTENRPQSPYSLQDDKKFFLMGGIASIAAFGAIAYFVYSNSKPIDMDELPIIRANTTPMKIKPSKEDHVGHQDKIVYDNISGEKTAAVAVKTIPPPEEVLSINEVDLEASLSEEEKKNIIKAFDDLAPDKEYKINYVKNGSKKGISSANATESGTKKLSRQNVGLSKNNSAVSNVGDNKSQTSEEHRIIANGLMIVEDGSLISSNNNATLDTVDDAQKSSDRQLDASYDPPIKRIKENSERNASAKKKKKSRLKNLVNELDDTSSASGGIMVQIASLPSKSAAEAEYKRLLPKNKILRGLRKSVVKVDLGRNKGLRYRILVGPFRNQSEAGKVIREMKQTGVNAYVSR